MGLTATTNGTSSSEICLSQLSGKFAWSASDLNDSDIFWDVKQPEVECLSEYFETGCLSTNIDFGMAELAAKIFRQCEDGIGFVVIRGLDHSAAPGLELCRRLMGFASYFGTIATQNSKGDLIAAVEDAGVGSIAQTKARAYLTNDRFNMHTDAPDLLGLYCVQTAKEGGASLVTSGATVHNELLEFHREYLSLYYNGLFYHMRGEEKNGELPLYRNPIFHFNNGKLSTRYYLTDYIPEAYRILGIEMSSSEKNAIRIFDEICNAPRNCYKFLMNKGDLAFYSNNAVLHGRTAFYDDKHGEAFRKLWRIWINPSRPRELPSNFARFRFGYER